VSGEGFGSYVSYTGSCGPPGQGILAADNWGTVRGRHIYSGSLPVPAVILH